MRFFEILLFFTTAISIILITYKSRTTKNHIKLFSLINVGIFVAHLFIENPCWQMFPLYLINILLFFILSYYNGLPDKSKFFKVSLYIIVVIFFLGSIVPAIFFPVFQLPQPTGQFRVGTKYFVLTDSSRAEIFSETTNDIREITVQAYYPALVKTETEPEPYWYNSLEWSSEWTKLNGFGFAPFIFSQLGLGKTHSYPGAEPVAQTSGFPILIFSHGYGQLAKFNTSILEELASNGYVVLSISHHYETPFAIYPDKNITVFPREGEWHKKRNRENSNAKLSEVLKKLYYEKSDSVKQQLYQELYTLQSSWNESNEIWAEDIIYCMDNLKLIDDLYFSNSADISNIGVLGFSFGGGASGYAAMIDKRIKAGVNMDGRQYGHLLKENLSCPFMFMNSEHHAGANEYFIKRAENTIYDFTLLNSRHANFNDMSYAVELPGKITGKLGAIDAPKGIKIIKKYVLAFFDEHLKQKNCELLKGNTENEDVVLIICNSENNKLEN